MRRRASCQWIVLVRRWVEVDVRLIVTPNIEVKTAAWTHEPENMRKHSACAFRVAGPRANSVRAAAEEHST